MEFLDEEAKPRFLFQSRAIPSSRPETETLNLRKLSVLVSLSISAILFGVSIFFLQSEPLRSISIWFALSLLVGPLAPSSITAGDIRVGAGRVLEPPPPPPQNDVVDQEDQKKKTPNRRSRARKNEELRFNPAPVVVEEPKRVHNSRDSLQREGNSGTKTVIVGGEREWSDGDVELLKQLLVKHPVGKPKRWEAIAEAFQGRHGLESVIKMAKSMGEKKTSDADSFAQFLKDRKPVDKRIEAGSEGVDGANGTVESGEVNEEHGGVNWSAGDDMALLNALKAFPKDAAMRWEKIAAAVPGKTKAACMKRVAELKKDFRSSKASAEA